MNDQVDIAKLEKSHISGMRRLIVSLDSPDPKTMYAAAGKMMAHENSIALLPKAMSLLDTDDATIRRLMFRTAAQLMYGKYVGALIEAFDNISPAEREQVLQLVEERLRNRGGPSSRYEQENWVQALQRLGREHQPTVLGIMSFLGRPGLKWVKDLVSERIQEVTPAAIHRLNTIPNSQRRRLLRLAVERAVQRNRELIPYIIDALDEKSLKYATMILREGAWRERAMVAAKVARLGIRSCRGIVLDILADPDWRVKQALLENIDISKSKFSALLQLLGYVIADSHARVRGHAERLALLLGIQTCLDGDLERQRTRVEKRYRKQLLRAAQHNPDVDSSWLGVQVVVPEVELEPEEQEEGLSLGDLGAGAEERRPSPGEEPRPESAPASPDVSSLLAALKRTKQSVSAGTQESVLKAVERVDESAAVTDRFIETLKELSESFGKDVPMESLRKELRADGVTDEDFERALEALERDGLVYRSGKDTVSYVDMEL